jgi:hypothetical protein
VLKAIREGAAEALKPAADSSEKQVSSTAPDRTKWRGFQQLSQAHGLLCLNGEEFVPWKSARRQRASWRPHVSRRAPAPRIF